MDKLSDVLLALADEVQDGRIYVNLDHKRCRALAAQAQELERDRDNAIEQALYFKQAAERWNDPAQVTNALVRYLLDMKIADPMWAAPMTRAIYAAIDKERGQ